VYSIIKVVFTTYFRTKVLSYESTKVVLSYLRRYTYSTRTRTRTRTVQYVYFALLPYFRKYCRHNIVVRCPCTRTALPEVRVLPEVPSYESTFVRFSCTRTVVYSSQLLSYLRRYFRTKVLSYEGNS
jgi:hypothetical protein